MLRREHRREVPRKHSSYFRPTAHLRRVPGWLPLLHNIPHHPAGRRTPGAVRQQGPCGRARPHPRGRHERRAGHRLDGAGLPSESLGRVRLRLPRLTGPAARPGGSPPLGPGPLQRDALRRRVAPGPDDLAAGDRPAERPAGGLRLGRQQRPTPQSRNGDESETSPLFEHGLGAGIIAAILSALEGDAVSCFGGESALGRVRFGEELRGGGLPCESSGPGRGTEGRTCTPKRDTRAPRGPDGAANRPARATIAPRLLRSGESGRATG